MWPRRTASPAKRRSPLDSGSPTRNTKPQRGCIGMADSMQINQAMQSLGTLWGAEHAEKDDDGVTQIEKLAKLLRKFRDHEAKEHDGDPNKGLREGTYQLGDGRSVYYDNGRE